MGRDTILQILGRHIRAALAAYDGSREHPYCAYYHVLRAMRLYDAIKTTAAPSVDELEAPLREGRPLPNLLEEPT